MADTFPAVWSSPRARLPTPDLCLAARSCVCTGRSMPGVHFPPRRDARPSPLTDATAVRVVAWSRARSAPPVGASARSAQHSDVALRCVQALAWSCWLAPLFLLYIQHRGPPPLADLCRQSPAAKRHQTSGNSSIFHGAAHINPG